VAAGDSLWTIARAYRCSVDDLRRVNRLGNNLIQPGQRLRIPVCKADDDAEQETRATRRRARTAAAEERRERERQRDESLDTGADGLDDGGRGDGAAERARGSFTQDSRSADDIALSEEPIASVDARDFESSAIDPRFIEPREEPREGSIDTPIDATREPYEPAREPYRPPREQPGTGDTWEPVAVPIVGQSIGRPQSGYLVSGKRMPKYPKLYHLRRPERAWGTSYTVDQLVHAIRLVRKRYPRVHPLAIGDLSARHGGRISMHGSHRSGRDADLGFYFRKAQQGYPKAFVVARPDNLDFPATWALISALCKTATDKTGGVERIYMTYRTQAMFYRLARKHGVSKARLGEWFQYPRGRRADHGVIRHEPGHEEHIHVRFRCAANDPECK
jgi:murein endopeptidase